MKHLLLTILALCMTSPAFGQLQRHKQALSNGHEVLMGDPTLATNAYDILDSIAVSIDSVISAMQKYGKNAGDYATLASALSDASSDTALINIGQIMTISQGKVISDSLVAINVNRGGGIKLNATSDTLHVYGPFVAGPYQVFFGDGMCNVVFHERSLTLIRPEWWGGKADSYINHATSVFDVQGTDNATAFQYAVDAVEHSRDASIGSYFNGYTIALMQGDYYVSNCTYVNKPNVRIIGPGHYNGTQIGGADTLLAFTELGGRLENVVIRGNGTLAGGGKDATTLGVVVYDIQSASGADIDEFRMEHTTVSLCSLGIEIKTRNSHIENNLFSVCYRGIEYTGADNPGGGGNRDLRVINNRFHSFGLGNHYDSDTTYCIVIPDTAEAGAVEIKNNKADDCEVFLDAALRSGQIHGNQMVAIGMHDQMIFRDNSSLTEGTRGEGVSIANNHISGPVNVSIDSTLTGRGIKIVAGRYYSVTDNKIYLTYGAGILAECIRSEFIGNILVDTNRRNAAVQDSSGLIAKGSNLVITSNVIRNTGSIYQSQTISTMTYGIDADTTATNYGWDNITLGVTDYRGSPTTLQAPVNLRVAYQDYLTVGQATVSTDQKFVVAGAAADNPGMSVLSGGVRIGRIGDSGGGDDGILQLYDSGATEQARIFTAGDSYINGDLTLGAMSAADTDLHLSGDGTITFTETGSTPTGLTQDTEVQIYVKADKLIFRFDNGDTVKYWYMDLTSTAATWTYTTSAP